MTASGVEAPNPDVAIRVRPPSPRRLSRKVLLTIAVIAGAIIAVAVVAGLSTPSPGAAFHQDETQRATAGPPQSIAMASAQYDAADLPRHAIEAPTPPTLAPPEDPSWSGAAPQSPQAASPPRADPEAAAHAAAIVFASARQPNTAANAAADSVHLNAQLTPPRSPYEIQAGNVIPAALLTALNSDAPGRVIAQVTAPVYDSVTGAHLLVPQGARLLGTYDNAVHYGDARIVLVWNRLILPNGWSIDLDAMNGADPTGAAGIADSVDNHLWRLGGAVGLSAIISVIANNSEGNDRSNSLTQSLGDAAAQQAAQTGSQIVGRELAVKPTLRVRAGANVRVLVTRDIRLRPYQYGGSDGGVGTP